MSVEQLIIQKKALLSQEIGVIGKSRGFHRLHLVVRPKCDQITFKFSDDFRIPKCGKEHGLVTITDKTNEKL